MSIYKMCDIRGTYGVELFDNHGERLGRAIAHLQGQVEVIVGGDGRLSTPALKRRLIAGLVEGGCTVIDLGTLPTPAFYFARRHLGVETGVMVTASHNPAGDNGFKIVLGPLPITPEEMRQLRDRMEATVPSPTGPQGEVRSVDILPEYLDFGRQQVPNLDGLRVVVDCANGMASLVAHPLWDAAGVRASFLFDTADGHFPNHPPNPAVAANLSALQRAVRDAEADLGIAYDGDADRVAFVDSLGRPLPNDKAIVIFARQALQAGPAPIVYDQKCSRIVPETIRALGGEPVIERSGHTFIKTTFLRLRAPYAGEISGHHFFRVLQGDDGVIASLYLAGIVHQSEQDLAAVADSIRSYPITPDIRLAMDSRSALRVLEDLKRGLAGEAALSTLDGLRADFEDGWGLARLSVTEPVLTLRFEGMDETALAHIMHRFERAAPDLAGRLPVPNRRGNR